MKQAFAAEVFIDLRPMDPVAGSRVHPMGTFFWCGVEKLGIPSQWATDGSPICEVDS